MTDVEWNSIADFESRAHDRVCLGTSCSIFGLGCSPNDEDLGSGGVLLLPDLPIGTAHYQRLAEAGKQRIISIVDRNDMAKYCCVTSGKVPTDTNIVQEIEGKINGMFGAPSYWNGYIYFGASGDAVKAFSFNKSTGAVSTVPVAQSVVVCGGGAHQSCSTSISSSGTLNGIVWALDSGTGFLHALNAGNLTELYTSGQVPSRDGLNGGVKFVSPTVANGKVYVGSNGQLGIYGLNPRLLSWSANYTVNDPSACGSVSNPEFTPNNPTVTLQEASAGSLNWTLGATLPSGGMSSSYNQVSITSWNISDSTEAIGFGSSGGSITTSKLPIGQPTLYVTMSGYEYVNGYQYPHCTWNAMIPLVGN